MRRRAPYSRVCGSTVSGDTGKRIKGKRLHWGAVHLQQVPALQIGIDKRWAQRRDEIYGSKERDDGEPEGSIERWQGRCGVDERARDEPRGDGDEGKEQYGGQATHGQGFYHIVERLEAKVSA